MTAPVFVVPGERLAARPGPVLVDGPEGRHAATVRRLRVGEPVELVDGSGTRGRGVVAATGKDSIHVDLHDLAVDPDPAPRLVVVQALPKGERAELAVEALSEVGADIVIPWQAARCVVQWRGDRAAKSLARWRATAREAGKQARRARFAEVTEPASTTDVARLLAGAALGAVLHEEASAPLADVQVPPAGDVVLVVGPEGGVAPEEIAAFGAAGAGAYRLGPSVLRTSTAGAVASAVVLSRTARWS
ncbi:16S rRNA (uracil(1498)-N(3))-methyltransferase [Motilibacter aurantiacus]|uniref:16S rRNA (uracil(1498)-N(3))-methyltransferase n=1 Tax=Motilibacter aurantiacus TaxID=2714955 RepID=UPI00140E57BB|nr:16S rRNA (uracil(1498)-N(3))-methyltransferase [Motilibacter aurantiacus]